MGHVLVIAEHQRQKFPKSTQVAIAAGQEAARITGGDCYAVVLGTGIDGLANDLAEYGVKKVFAIDDSAYEHYLAGPYAAAIAQVVKDKGIDLLLAAATATGKDLLPRAAALLNAGMASEVVAFNADGTFQRPMWAGNVLATVALEGSPRAVSVRATALDPAAKGGNKAEIERVSVSLDAAAQASKFVSFSETKSDRPVLTEARVIVAGGRALKSAENFQTVLEPLVDTLGAALGASRAAVDAGFVANDLQIGQTGKVVAPDLYIAVGISGAIQHVAGMKDSKVIVAINKDEEAPIFQVSDYGLVADLFKAIPELKDEVEKLKH
ncbi:MAG: electron transfer flavoprotein subunit alpha/FixB family protein [Candidatus Binatia bacterium]